MPNPSLAVSSRDNLGRFVAKPSAVYVASILKENDPYKCRRTRRATILATLDRPDINRFPLASESLIHELCGLEIVKPDVSAITRSIAKLDVTVANREIFVKWTTNKIVFEEIDLGRFRITYEPRRFTFAVEALEPNPAYGQDSITHPHVRRGRICLGERNIPGLRALGTTGNFLLVRRTIDSILNTYNPGSPYVKLENWVMRHCPICGRNTARPLRHCAGCDNNACTMCARYVGGNGDNGGYYCRDCAGLCCSCDCNFLTDDLSTCDCPHCNDNHCMSCLER